MARTLRSKLQEIVSVKDFGAAGDGSTDDTTAIQAAIDYAKSLTRGGSVYIPPGIYKTTAQINFWPTVPILGDGSWCTVLQVNPAASLTDPAFIMGDAAWRLAGGSPTTKGWRFEGVRIETSGANANGHGLYLVGVAGANVFDVQITGFTSAGKYGLVLSGNTDPGDGAGADLGESNTEIEGHYNTFVGCYVFGNTHGVYFGGDYDDGLGAANGQSNSNTWIGGAIRQNDSRNLTLSATNNNTFIGVSLEAKSGTDFGIYGGYTRCQDNRFYGCRFEGTYDTAPWRFVDDSNIKRNLIDMPVYGAVYNTVDPTSGSFVGDPGGRNYCRQMDLNGNLIYYGPDQKYVKNGATTALPMAALIDTFTVTAAHSATGANAGTSFVNGRIDTSTTATTTAAHYRFYNPNGQVGSISTNASATSFNTSSDYRLKYDFQAFNPGSLIDSIKVYDFAWKDGGSRSNGVVAQEIYELYPNAVYVGKGEPGDGDFEPWAVDYSKLVPVLLREMQLLRARVASLESSG